MKNILFGLLLLGIFFCQCSSDDDTEALDDLKYISLVIEKDTIMAGDQVKITATATGSELKYYWSATKGDILGSGAEVTYASSPCHIGTNTITCKITNGSTQEETKTIDVIVKV